MARSTLENWGQRLHWTGLLIFANEFLFWQRADNYTTLEWLPIIGLYGVLGWLTFDLIARWNVGQLRELVLIGGTFSLLQSSTITANFASDLPMSILLFGTGIGVLAFLTAFALWWLSYHSDQSRMLLIGIGLAGVTSGFWVNNVAEAAELNWPAVDLNTTLPVLAGGLVVHGLVSILMSRYERHPVMWRLGFWQWIAIITALIVALIARLANETLSLGGAVIVLMLLVMIQLILWFGTTLEQSRSSYLNTPKQTEKRWSFGTIILVSGLLLVGHIAGYGLADRLDVLGTLIFLGTIIFGASWLPLISTQLGFKAFVNLVDEEMFS